MLDDKQLKVIDKLRADASLGYANCSNREYSRDVKALLEERTELLQMVRHGKECQVDAGRMQEERDTLLVRVGELEHLLEVARAELSDWQKGWVRPAAADLPSGRSENTAAKIRAVVDPVQGDEALQ